jgi:hypothetical protein
LAGALILGIAFMTFAILFAREMNRARARALFFSYIL